MPRPTLVTRWVFAVAFATGATTGTSAQEGVYLQGSVFADVRQFGSSSGALRNLIDEFSLDATGIGGSIRVGTWLHRRWTIEAGLDVSNRTTVEMGNPFILAIFPPGRLPLDLEASAKFTSVTTMLGFHQRAGDEVRLGYRAGFSFVRATYRTEIPDFVRPPVILSGNPFGPIDLPLLLTEGTLTTRQNHGALALAFEAAIEIADDLEVVPEVRALAFSRSGSDVFLIRPGAGVRWQF